MLFFLQHFLLLFRTPPPPLSTFISYLTGYAFSGSFVESSKFYWLLNIGVFEDSVLQYRLNIQLPEASHGPFKLKMPKIRLWFFFFLPFFRWHIHPSSCWDQILWSHPSLFPTSISIQQILANQFKNHADSDVFFPPSLPPSQYKTLSDFIQILAVN